MESCVENGAIPPKIYMPSHCHLLVSQKSLTSHLLSVHKRAGRDQIFMNTVIITDRLTVIEVTTVKRH
jgi:hypothetical protein